MCAKSNIKDVIQSVKVAGLLSVEPPLGTTAEILFKSGLIGEEKRTSLNLQLEFIVSDERAKFQKFEIIRNLFVFGRVGLDTLNEIA